jgi:hypothetical protein
VKNLSKKILSILTAVALLFSFAVPAGALTVGARMLRSFLLSFFIGSLLLSFIIFSEVIGV